ncbi:MAG: BREX-2 system phosphatase PglZ [Deltaproteobacteria bacterium]|nr:BREX-2 system phosphatase PglZ [Deltaproteobacteria bacterium]
MTDVDAPVLTTAALEAELGKFHNTKHRNFRSAVFADMEDVPSSIEVKVLDESTSFRVMRVQGELELRQRLIDEAREEGSDVAKSGSGEQIVYLIPFTRTLPRDLACRFASGRVVWPSIETKLPFQFGGVKGTPRLTASKLRKVVQAEDSVEYGSVGVATIDVDDAWMTYLSHYLGGRALHSVAAILSAAMRTPKAVLKALGVRLKNVEGAVEELCTAVDTKLGADSALVLRGILDGHPIPLAVYMVIGEGIRQENNADVVLRFGKLLQRDLKKDDANPLQAVAKEGAAALLKALRSLSLHTSGLWQLLDDDEKREVLAKADGLLDEDLAEGVMASNRLAAAFQARTEDFNDAVQQAAKAVDEECRRWVLDAGNLLMQHESCFDGEAIAMVVRLVNWLAQDEHEASNATNDVARLSEWYVREGGFVDWARKVARAKNPSSVHVAVSKLLSVVDERRTRIDKLFAASYADCVAHSSKRSALVGVTRIEEAIEKMALPVLDAEDLNLLVLCMDGMSWANLAEMWSSLRTQPEGAAFIPMTLPGQDGGDLPPPVIAAIPTITTLSRGSLFAGRLLGEDDSKSTANDPKRLKEHRGVRSFTSTATVLLKKDIFGEGGKLKLEAKAKVASNERVVGVVVNTIDDQLKGSPQFSASLSLGDITPLCELLAAAAKAGRAVLLCSDHGHITSQRFSETSAALPKRKTKDDIKANISARWRPIGEEEEADVGEVALTSHLAESGRIALAVDEKLRYVGQVHQGEHGGLSLAEAVAPAFLLVPEALVEPLQGLPKPLNMTDLVPPSCWATSLPQESAEKPPAKKHQVKKKKTPKKNDAQQSLFALPAEESSTTDDVLVSQLFASLAFKEMMKGTAKNKHEMVKKALTLLIENQGRVSKVDFAKALKLPAFRVAGALTLLSGVMNVDQEQVVSMDKGQTQVELNRDLLKLIFLEN